MTPVNNNDKNRQIWTLFVVLLVLIAGSLLLRVDNGVLDRLTTDSVYQSQLPPGGRFYLAASAPWSWFNRNDTTFTFVLLLPLLGLFILSFLFPEYRHWRRYAGFGLTAFILGPGLVVNVLFKGYWGRPRPQQTELWPNSMNPSNLPFYRVWDPAFLDGHHKPSFPSGHVSIVVIYLVLFYMFNRPEIVAYFSPRYSVFKEKLFAVLKYSGIIIAIAGGILMGAARIVKGAHHLSDVFWSFGMVFLVTWALYHYVFRIRQWEDQELKRRKGLQKDGKNC
ncbi:phosphatase PAP2 family protein [bacterium]|nr:phosphatase PAP2 family protein [bacterium]